LPIGSNKLSKAQLSSPSKKIEKRLQTWKCGSLSYGEKAVLLSSTLSSIPIYTMGLYWLHEGTHQRLDAARARFFWQGVGSKRKYHMVKWDTLARPKEFGGLVFLGMRAMSTVLLAKWINCIDGGVDSPCIKLFEKKRT